MLVTNNKSFPDLIPDLDIDLKYVDRRNFEFDAAGRSWKVALSTYLSTPGAGSQSVRDATVRWLK